MPCTQILMQLPVVWPVSYTHLIKERDLIFYEAVEDEGYIESRPGCFCVFFPSDIHRPQVISGEAMNLRKVVVKAVSYTHLDVYKRQAQS